MSWSDGDQSLGLRLAAAAECVREVCVFVLVVTGNVGRCVCGWSVT